MLPSLLIGGTLLLVYALGQKQTKINCNIDPDAIFFDNEELEKIRNSFSLGGDCSTIWKGEFDGSKSDQRVTKDTKRSNHQDRRLLNYLNGPDDSLTSSYHPDYYLGLQFQKNRQPEHHPEILFGSESQTVSMYVDAPEKHKRSKPQILEEIQDFEIQKRTEGITDLLRPNNQRNLQRPKGPQGFFGTGVPSRRQTERRPNNYQSRPEKIILPPVRTTPPKYPENFQKPENSGGNQRLPIHQNEFVSFNNQRGPPLSSVVDWFGSPFNGRPQTPRRQDNFFPPTNQRQPQQNAPENLFDFALPQKPKFQVTTYNQRKPQNQDAPPPSRQRRPQGSPDDQFRPDGQSRPQTVGRPNFGQTNNQTVMNDVGSNQNTVVVQRPQTTTSRPGSTTLPGPPTWATAPSICVRRCPNTPEYNPVCGSDRVTYRNPGRLRCEQGCGKSAVEINHYGNCATTTTQTPSTTTANV